MEEEALDLFSKSIHANVHVVQGLDEVLQLHILVLFHGLDDAGAQMRLHLQLVWLLLLLAFHGSLLVRDGFQLVLLLLISLI